MLIDTHCHLTDPRLQQQLEEVLSRAAATGVDRMITISTDLADAERCIALCRAHPQVKCAIGVHPHHAAKVDLGELPRFIELQRDSSVVALGEMGLDYHYDFSPVQRQKEVFERQLQFAADLRRPVVIHCRQAVDDTLAILGQFPHVPAVFHCFTGAAAEAQRVLDRGYLIGFTGVVTFRKSDELREVVRNVPRDRMLIETDAPYLSPEPVRKQKVNEPALVRYVADAISQIRAIERSETEQITTDNARRFFNL